MSEALAIHNIISDAVKNLRAVVDILETFNLNDDANCTNGTDCGIVLILEDSKLVRELNEFREKYMESTAKYVEILEDEKNHLAELAAARKEYKAVVLCAGFVPRITQLEEQVRVMYNEIAAGISRKNKKKVKKSQAENIVKCFNMLDAMSNKPVLTQHNLYEEDTMEKICDNCKTPMILNATNNEYICLECKYRCVAYGIVPTDGYWENASGPKTSKKYSQQGNCHAWLDRIQGIEKKNIPPMLIEQLKHKARDEGVLNIAQVTSKKIREWLKCKDIDKPTYNSHITKIKWQLTEEEPVRLTDDEKSKFSYFLPKLIIAYNTQKGPNLKNSRYQPYLILKLAEKIMDRSTPAAERRFLRFASNIHLQEAETINKNDAILSNLDIGLQFEPTDISYYETNCM